MTRPLIMKNQKEAENGTKQDKTAEKDPLAVRGKNRLDLLRGNGFGIANCMHCSFGLLVSHFLLLY